MTKIPPTHFIGINSPLIKDLLRAYNMPIKITLSNNNSVMTLTRSYSFINTLTKVNNYIKINNFQS